mmetsp:Transcript_87080/g.244246  ORF Transcript_87080/g.244246 Transcript_87080/m.244246 type:complete len:217 (+) Transcript_87080:2235-2885(+)
MGGTVSRALDAQYKRPAASLRLQLYNELFGCRRSAPAQRIRHCQFVHPWERQGSRVGPHVPQRDGHLLRCQFGTSSSRIIVLVRRCRASNRRAIDGTGVGVSHRCVVHENSCLMGTSRLSRGLRNGFGYNDFLGLVQRSWTPALPEHVEHPPRRRTSWTTPACGDAGWARVAPGWRPEAVAEPAARQALARKLTHDVVPRGFDRNPYRPLLRRQGL